MLDAAVKALSQILSPPMRSILWRSIGLALVLIVVERSPYTSELRLTYEFNDAEGKRLSPDIWVKVYRDARVAEALHCGMRPMWLAQDGGDVEAGEFIHDQWDRNHTLAKWLEYLLEHGHGFSMAARPRTATIASR